MSYKAHEEMKRMATKVCFSFDKDINKFTDVFTFTLMWRLEIEMKTVAQLPVMFEKGQLSEKDRVRIEQIVEHDPYRLWNVKVAIVPRKNVRMSSWYQGAFFMMEKKDVWKILQVEDINALCKSVCKTETVDGDETIMYAASVIGEYLCVAMGVER
jgi:hypothetical protein